MMEKAIKKMQSEHESLNNDSLQSKHESEIVPYLNCNPVKDFIILEKKMRILPLAKLPIYDWKFKDYPLNCY